MDDEKSTSKTDVVNKLQYRDFFELFDSKLLLFENKSRTLVIWSRFGCTIVALYSRHVLDKFNSFIKFFIVHHELCSQQDRNLFECILITLVLYLYHTDRTLIAP